MIFTVSNIITVFRIFLVPFFIACTVMYTPQQEHLRYAALGIFLVAGFSDLLDGFIARKYHQESALGSMLDPIADKLLMISAFLCLYYMGRFFPEMRVPLWLVFLVFGRGLLLFFGTVVIYRKRRQHSLSPRFLGKTTVFMEAVCIVWFLLLIPAPQVVWWLTACLVVASTVDYIRKGIELNLS